MPKLISARCSQRCSQLAESAHSFVLRYSGVEIYRSARKHGIADEDIEHAIEHALVAADDDDKVLYLGPDRAGNMLEIVTVVRDDGTEIVIHAMAMRPIYETLLHETGRADD